MSKNPGTSSQMRLKGLQSSFLRARVEKCFGGGDLYCLCSSTQEGESAHQNCKPVRFAVLAATGWNKSRENDLVKDAMQYRHVSSLHVLSERQFGDMDVENCPPDSSFWFVELPLTFTAEEYDEVWNLMIGEWNLRDLFNVEIPRGCHSLRIEEHDIYFIDRVVVSEYHRDLKDLGSVNVQKIIAWCAVLSINPLRMAFAIQFVMKGIDYFLGYGIMPSPQWQPRIDTSSARGFHHSVESVLLNREELLPFTPREEHELSLPSGGWTPWISLDLVE